MAKVSGLDCVYCASQRVIKYGSRGGIQQYKLGRNFINTYQKSIIVMLLNAG
jgi:hypothetical protein